MAEVSEMMTGVKAFVWTPLYAGLIVALLFWSSYRQIARIFKWLTLVLFAYVLAAFLARPDWRAVLTATVIPHIEWSNGYLATFVGILGTTISPYLFFWQAAEEVEEDRAAGRRTIRRRRGATDAELRRARTDVVTGMFFSNLVMYFIILTTAATLHAHGQTRIATARQAAEALRPLAGAGARTGSLPSGCSARACSASPCSRAPAPTRWPRRRAGEGPSRTRPVSRAASTRWWPSRCWWG
jgi:Mn2+/Fe2+ NRAMP family transporter